jgi:hypothetical protein
LESHPTVFFDGSNADAVIVAREAPSRAVAKARAARETRMADARFGWLFCADRTRFIFARTNVARLIVAFSNAY